MVTIEDIKHQYHQHDVCMAELLAQIPANGLSVEEAFLLYTQAMNYADKDSFFQIADGAIRYFTESGEVVMETNEFIKILRNKLFNRSILI